jgi:DNA primase
MKLSEIITLIKDKIDIVDFISEYVSLKKRGKNYVGLCPFHSERTPSFTVSREKQLFHCFGCHAGGDLIKFIMMYENITYKEAIKKLSTKAGLNITLDDVEQMSEEEKEKADIKNINFDAAILYSKYLKSSDGKKAREFLSKRNIKDSTIDLFNIGYAPDSYYEIFNELSKKYSKELLLKSQIVMQSSGRIMDVFRNRIMFPIRSINGDIIGFGGRTIDNEDPKYLNSSQTPVFSKGKVIFGLYNALPYIKKEKKAIIVEGYIDTVILHQYRLNNTVSPLGTSLTIEQARILSNYADEVIIIFDSDRGGILASIKAADAFIEAGVYPRIVLLPQNLDPDEYIIKNGIDEMLNLINNAKDVIEFKISLIKEKKTTFSPNEKLKIVEFISQSISKQRNEIIKHEWIKKASESLNIPENLIQRYSFKKTEKINYELKKETDRDPIIETNLIEILLKNPKYLKLEFVSNFSIDYLSSDFAKDIFGFLKNNQIDENTKIYDLIVEKFPNYSQKITKILVGSNKDEEIINPQNLIETLITIKKQYLKKQLKEMKKNIKNLSNEDFKKIDEISKEFKNLEN